MKKLKQRLKAGETLTGCWLSVGSPITAEIVGMAGFDWVLIDLEHGAGTERDVLPQLQALEHTTAAALVRVESTEPARLQHVLDTGAEGVMCPRIATVDDAKRVVQALQFPPKGSRGMTNTGRATGYGHHFSSYYQDAADNILGIIQIETREVLDHLDAIAALDGVDVLFIGPADLSMALGHFGEYDHPQFLEALQETINAARKAGKATGIIVFDPDDFAKYHQQGIRMIASGSDVGFVARGARQLAQQLNTFKGFGNPANV